MKSGSPARPRLRLLRELARSYTVLLPVIGLAGLTMAWQLAVTAGHLLHIPPAHAPAGVVGFIVVHDYSKRQELVLYALSQLAVAACVTGAVVEWRWYAGKLFSLGIPVTVAVWISGATFFVPIAVTLATLPGGAFFIKEFLFVFSLLGILVLQAAAAMLWPTLNARLTRNRALTTRAAGLQAEPPRGNT